MRRGKSNLGIHSHSSTLPWTLRAAETEEGSEGQRAGQTHFEMSFFFVNAMFDWKSQSHGILRGMEIRVVHVRPFINVIKIPFSMCSQNKTTAGLSIILLQPFPSSILTSLLSSFLWESAQLQTCLGAAHLGSTSPDLSVGWVMMSPSPLLLYRSWPPLLRNQERSAALRCWKMPCRPLLVPDAKQNQTLHLQSTSHPRDIKLPRGSVGIRDSHVVRQGGSIGEVCVCVCTV